MSDHDVTLAADRCDGADAIGAYLGMKPRRVYYLASQGALPGVYRVGKKLEGLKSKMREGFEAKATGKVA